SWRLHCRQFRHPTRRFPRSRRPSRWSLTFLIGGNGNASPYDGCVNLPSMLRHVVRRSRKRNPPELRMLDFTINRPVTVVLGVSPVHYEILTNTLTELFAVGA